MTETSTSPAPQAPATPPSPAAAQGDRDGQNATTTAGQVGDTLHNAGNAIADTASGIGSSISGFFSRFGTTMHERGIGQAISDAFSEMGTGGFIGAILGGLGAMFIGSIFGGGMIGMIAGILMVPLGIILGSQQGRGPIEHGVSSLLGATPRQTGGATAENSPQITDPALAAAYQQALERDVANGGQSSAPPQVTLDPSSEYRSPSYPPGGYNPGYHPAPSAPSNTRWHVNANVRFDTGHRHHRH